MTTAPDTKKITEPLRFDLTDNEVATIARERERVLIEGEDLERNFESLKGDHKYKKTNIENRLAALSQRVRDGFEMRPTELEITFNDPERGRKTTRRVETGVTIRVEAMTALDVEQRTLPLEETKQTEQAPESPSEVAAEPGAGGLKIVDGDGESAPNGIEPHPNLTQDGQRTGTLSQTPGGEHAGETSLGTQLDKAAAEKELPRVPLDLAKFGSDYTRAAQAFKKAAKKAEWPQASISILAEKCSTIIKERDPKAEEKVFAILAAHVCAETK